MQLIFDSLEEVKEFMVAFGSETKPAAKRPAKKPEAPAKEVVKEEPAAKEYTLIEVRSTLAELMKKGKRTEVNKLIGSYASKLTEVEPKDYAELLEKAGEL